MIIFGWGRRKVKKFGKKKAYHCSNCNNDAYWELIQVTTWFTLFFIPIIPYSNKKLLVCPICNSYIEISKEEFEKLKNVEVNNNINPENYGKNQTQLNFIKEMNAVKEQKKKNAEVTPDA